MRNNLKLATLLLLLPIFVFSTAKVYADNFQTNYYFTITAIAGEGGYINPAGTVPVNSGDSLTFIIFAKTDYMIQSVFINGVAIGAVATYTFTQVLADQRIEAYFIKTASNSTAPTPTPTVTPAPTPSGTPTGPFSIYISDVNLGDVTENQTVTSSLSITYSGGQITLKSVDFSEPFNSWVSMSEPYILNFLDYGQAKIALTFTRPYWTGSGDYNGTVTVTVQDSANVTRTATAQVSVSTTNGNESNAPVSIFSNIPVVVGVVIAVLACLVVITKFSRH